jgi:RES domain-containing protein
VTVAPVVDFRQGFRSATWAPLWEEFFCDWRQLWFNEHIEPPSWVLGDEAIAAGAKGILFPSTMAAPGVNLVLYVDRFDADDVIEVFDPSGALPKNQDSWR